MSKKIALESNQTTLVTVQATSQSSSWTAEAVAQFVIDEDASLERFAQFVRTERIDGNIVPLLTYEIVKDVFQDQSVGQMLRFWSSSKKLKRI